MFLRANNTRKTQNNSAKDLRKYARAGFPSLKGFRANTLPIIATPRFDKACIDITDTIA